MVHRPIAPTDIDPAAAKIIQRLVRFDHTAYLVGGCVRDLLLDRRPKDFDIGTTATPRQVKRLFSNCRIIGRRFRLAHIYFQDDKIIEVATFRARNLDDYPEGSQGGDGGLLIRNDNVFGTPEDDALRRDFTINALFYDVNAENVLDHANGLGDLRRQRVRTIGDPEIRFREDPIRILRAVRFAARLDFHIEEKTLEAFKRTRNLIPRAAPSRVLEEINRFCRGGAARRSFELLRETRVFEVILPDFAEGYQEDPPAWNYLLDLLDVMDGKQASGHHPTTGEILAVLLLPLMSRKMGWQEDGTTRQRHDTHVRELADAFLRPTAMKLRGSRRDQESCRQILLTLSRMVPANNIRRSTRQAILRRSCTPDCLWILQAVAKRFDGEFTVAHKYWSAALSEVSTRPQKARPGARDREAAAAQTGAQDAGPRPRRRSPRRQKPRQQKEPSKSEQRPGSRVSPARSKGAEMPPPWDDSYFFAALPSVPDSTGDENPQDREMAPTGAAVNGSGDDGGGPPAKPRRKRRRRRKSPANRSEKPAQGQEDPQSSPPKGEDSR